MATTGTQPAATQAGLQELAKRHLWMHFTRHGAFDGAEVPIIVRGEGAYVWDEHGNRYLDGLSALFCVNAGHGRTELGEAAARQVEELDFYTIWSYAHPRAIELATRIASLAPGDLNRVFFTSGGSEAVESAIKLARAYHQRTGQSTEDEVHQPRDRLPRHHARGAGRHRHLGTAPRIETGYVGLPLAIAFAEAGEQVVGVDVDAAKVSSLRAGRSHIEDIPEERLQAVLDRLAFETRFVELHECEAILVCVPTPLTRNREPDLGPLLAAARGVGGSGAPRAAGRVGVHDVPGHDA